MDKREVLNLPGEELYNKFVEKVLTNVFDSMDLVAALEKSERFTRDFIFRIHVQTARQFIFVATQSFSEVFEKADELIDRALALGLPKILTLNYHILGISYKLSGSSEKAIECFFNVLKYERVYELKNLTSIVYFYIGELYVLNEGYEIGIEYIKLGMEVLEETKEQEPRYEMKKTLLVSEMIYALYLSKRFDEMEPYLEMLRQQTVDYPSDAAKYSYSIAMMYYYFSKQELEKAKAVFHDLLEGCGKDSASIKQYTKIFCAMLWEYSPETSFYEKELLAVEHMPESPVNLVDAFLHKFLYQYYEKIGSRNLAFANLEKAFQYIEKEMMQLKRNSVNFLQLVEKSFSMEENIFSEQKKNTELKMVAEEALRNKELAELAFHRLGVVSELGKKLTYSLGVQDIIETVYNKLLENIPLESFILMVKNEELNRLETLAYYERGVHKENVYLDYGMEDSAFVEVFQTNQFIKIDDFKESDRFQKQRARKTDDYFRSLLFMPLHIENEILGVCSIQHSTPEIYKKEDVEFLEQLMSYLAIALNNAFKSEELEKEIKKHKETQKELEQVNQILEKLSYLDGLTQISNRRDFENRIMDYLHRSREEQCAISVFMFDIDYFKNYNDTYGHLEGDKALKAVATIIQKIFEQINGISARFGGEEFIAACLDMSREKCEELGEKIRKEVYALGIENEKTPLGGLTISVGIAYHSGEGEVKKSAIMRWADICLYNAKCTGKNKVIVKEITSEDEPPEGLE